MRVHFFILIVAASFIQSQGLASLRDNSYHVISEHKGALKKYKDLIDDGFLEASREEKSKCGLRPRVLLQENAKQTCLILRIKDDTPEHVMSRLLELLKETEGEVTFKLNTLIKGYVICFESACAPVKLLHAIKSVAGIEKDQRISIEQWASDRIQPGKNLTEKSRFGPHLDYGKINVYVVDTGIWTRHGEFDGKARLGYSLFNNRFGEDCNGHGTQVASLIGGQSLGVAPGVNLIGVQAMDCDGEGSVSNMLRALEWVYENAEKPAIVNMSFNGCKSDILDAAIDKLIDSGISVVAAAGNSACDACQRSPSSSSRAIIVGASDKDDRRAKFSNYGKCITLFAPGCNIIAASVPFTPKSMFSPAPGQFLKSSDVVKQKHPEDRYVVTSGTSFAAPFVSGSMALMLARNASFYPTDLRERLLNGSQWNALKADSLNNSPNLLLQLPF